MLATKRKVIAQVFVCQGCCCGQLERGRPEVPVEWLKQGWRKRELLKRVQWTVSGCLGPCDVPNVVSIVTVTQTRTVWLGAFLDEINTCRYWTGLRCENLGRAVDIPSELLVHLLGDPVSL